jgi:hypothetical protein
MATPVRCRTRFSILWPEGPSPATRPPSGVGPRCILEHYRAGPNGTHNPVFGLWSGNGASGASDSSQCQGRRFARCTIRQD